MIDPSTSSEIRASLLALQPEVAQVTRASVRDVGMYGCILRAALAKSFEFVHAIHEEPPPVQGYFTTATLRGICEDLIVLTFLDALSEGERNEVTALQMTLQLGEGINAQREFFGAERDWQPVVDRFPAEAIAKAEKRLREISAGLGWSGRQAWPSVWFMAKRVALEPLYRYLYSATSKWVHHSPHVLLRMGWGGKEGDLGEHTEWTFTTSNFGAYYTSFNQTYSLYLLLRLLRGPSAALVSPDAEPVLSRLEQSLKKPIRWPEAVTFEELNIKGPHPILRVLMRVAKEAQGTE